MNSAAVQREILVERGGNAPCVVARRSRPIVILHQFSKDERLLDLPALVERNVGAWFEPSDRSFAIPVEDLGRGLSELGRLRLYLPGFA